MSQPYTMKEVGLAKEEDGKEEEGEVEQDPMVFAFPHPMSSACLLSVETL